MESKKVAHISAKQHKLKIELSEEMKVNLKRKKAISKQIDQLVDICMKYLPKLREQRQKIVLEVKEYKETVPKVTDEEKERLAKNKFLSRVVSFKNKLERTRYDSQTKRQIKYTVNVYNVTWSKITSIKLDRRDSIVKMRAVLFYLLVQVYHNSYTGVDGKHFYPDLYSTSDMFNCWMDNVTKTTFIGIKNFRFLLGKLASDQNKIWDFHVTRALVVKMFS